MMTQSELDQRARQRSIDERLHTFKVAGQPLYLVRSRKTEPGAMHQVRIDERGQVTSCSCAGYYHRRSCTHAQAVERRLEREGKRSHAVLDGQPFDRPLRGRSQLYREEA